jgi:hypothetical protein
LSYQPESLKHIIKRETHRGIFHALTKDQRLAMKNKFFLPSEIRDFDGNTSTDFRSTYFQRMMKSRVQYVAAMRANGWKDSEIAARIRRFLRRKGGSPWDWFRLEYDTMTQRPTLTKAKFASFLKNRREVSNYMGRAYGRLGPVKKTAYAGLKGVPKPKGYRGMMQDYKKQRQF